MTLSKVQGVVRREGRTNLWRKKLLASSFMLGLTTVEQNAAL
jgi:hypothetical protein